MSTLEETEEGIILLENRIESNKKEITARNEENKHLAFSVKLLKLKREELLKAKPT